MQPRARQANKTTTHLAQGNHGVVQLVQSLHIKTQQPAGAAQGSAAFDKLCRAASNRLPHPDLAACCTAHQSPAALQGNRATYAGGKRPCSRLHVPSAGQRALGSEVPDGSITQPLPTLRAGKRGPPALGHSRPGPPHWHPHPAGSSPACIGSKRWEGLVVEREGAGGQSGKPQGPACLQRRSFTHK